MIILPISAGGPLNATGKRERIRRAFHRQADEYDQHAFVQKRVVARLDELIGAHQIQEPARALDIGCGTGGLLATLHGRYPHASFCGLDLAFNMVRNCQQRFDGDAVFVNSDAEHLPFGDGVFDLVVSASTFQWIERLDSCFKECRRVLRSGGLFCVAFFGGNTFWELRESYQEAIARRFGTDNSRMDRVHRFRDWPHVQRLISESGFEQVLATAETEMEYHASVQDLLRSIKAIGAATANRFDAGGGLGWRGVLNDMAGIYGSRFQSCMGIPATYEVIYLVVRRGAAD
jgi:malonyl-CoA O-methyltransferase